MDLTERVALVTGASSGIGAATAKAFADKGVRVGLAARSEAKLENVAEQIEADGGEALAVPTDIRDEAQVAAMIEQTQKTFDGLDVLVNNAATGHKAAVAEADLDAWRRTIETNLLGLMVASHLAVTEMLNQGGGHIVNVSSINGRKPAPGVSDYTASKFGITGFSKTLREEVMEDGIKVTLIEPGIVDTRLQPDEVRAIDDILDPEDVAAAIVYAASQPDHVNINTIQLQETENLA